MGKLFVISGSSGVGKGTVIKEFLNKHPEFKLSVSCTTRKPREGEFHGINYFFLSQDEFQTCIDNNEFLEWAEFSGNRYGTQKEYVKTKLNEGKNLILEIDTQGALQVREASEEAVLVFIAPPSLEELRRRLTGRGTESAEEVEKRLSWASDEIALAEKYDYIIFC